MVTGEDRKIVLEDMVVQWWWLVIVVEEGEDGEIYPVVRSSIYKKAAKASPPAPAKN